MARTESAMLALGTPAPPFTLPDVVSGHTITLADLRGSRGLLVMFLCSHCPFVKHLEQSIAQFARDYAASGLTIVAVSSNDAEAYPDDGPAGLKEQALRLGFPFPYLYDASQAVARSYDATCTPDFFLFDASHRLVYRGQFDTSRPGNGISPTGEDLRRAVDALLAGRPISADQRPSVGCNIKWKAG
jgi:peroxiredoxin